MTQNCIKIYGERNSGTNLLSNILRANFPHVKVYDGNYTKTFERWLKLVTCVLPDHMRFRSREHIRNFLDVNFLTEQYSWKHKCLPSDLHLTHPNLNVVTITKDPYSWLYSMYIRPYGSHHFGNTENKLSFSAFLREPWITQSRENDLALYSNPVQLWNSKVKSYSEVKNRHLHLRYEDVLVDYDASVFRLGIFLDQILENDIVKIKRDVKKSTKNYSDYYDFYINKKFMRYYNEHDLSYVQANLDDTCVTWSGYSV